MTESTPPEGGPLTLVQIQQLHRSLTEKVLDRAASDPEWKQLLIGDPELAMREANFPEAQELGQAQQSAAQAWQEGEVAGQQGYAGPGGRPPWWRYKISWCAFATYPSEGAYWCAQSYTLH